jgi:hypothetical protein
MIFLISIIKINKDNQDPDETLELEEGGDLYVQQLHLQMLCFTHLIGLIFSTVFKINYLLHF